MKHVKEKLYEKFEEKSDPVEDMGIGVPELQELRKSYKEVEKYINFDIEDLNFDEVYTTLMNLKKIIPYTVVFYFNQKYNLKIKLHGPFYGGNVFATGRIAGNKLLFHLSNSGLSVMITISGSAIHEETPQCKSIHRLEAAFLKECKKLGISLK
jgi:hypothetical protein